MRNHDGRGREVARRPGSWDCVVLCAVMLLGACGSEGSDGNPEQSSGGGAGDSGQSPGELTYCDVKPIVDRYCVRCHSDPTQNGAPMALTTWEDVEAVRARAADLVERELMPYTALELEPPVEPLPAEEKALLLEWLDAGAPPGTCD